MSKPQQQPKVPFSFHCNICFESLNLTDRAPVVLPCGHTYLCELCAKRLDKCMECRTPLTTVVHRTVQPTPSQTPDWNWNSRSPRRPVSQAATLRSSYSSRGSPSRPQSPPPPAPVEKTDLVPLPLPRNYVLMSLIEAAVQTSSVEAIDRDGYESGDDDELVRHGIKVIGSSSGTYVVREKGGLKARPNKSRKQKILCRIGGVRDEEDDFKTLKYGQTVQISRFENGIGTIARGAGYILVDNSSQLVKVGEVTDEACKLEASSRVLSNQLEELEKEMNRIKKVKDSTNIKLKEALADTESSGPFGPVPQDIHELSHVDEITSLEPAAQDDYPKIMESQSYDDRGVSVVPSIRHIEPSRSFENCYVPVDPQGEGTSTCWPASFGGTDIFSTQTGGYRTSNESLSIDFASGLSGHRGLNQAQKLKNKISRNHAPMMSQHRGITSISRKATSTL